MNRRLFCRSLSVCGSVILTGCSALPSFRRRLDSDSVFESHRFDGTDLLVTFRDSVDVTSASTINGRTSVVYERIDEPARTVRFQVIRPTALETDVGLQLHVRATVGEKTASKRIPCHVHGHIHNCEILSDGRVRFDLENQAIAPLLVRFISVYGDVPNPAVDPTSDSFEWSELPATPGVVGVESDRPVSPMRSDLVIEAGKVRTFETTYAPFAVPGGAGCESKERYGSIAVVHGNESTAAYDLQYRLGGMPTEVDGATVCPEASTIEQ